MSSTEPVQTEGVPYLTRKDVLPFPLRLRFSPEGFSSTPPGSPDVRVRFTFHGTWTATSCPLLLVVRVSGDGLGRHGRQGRRIGVVPFSSSSGNGPFEPDEGPQVPGEVHTEHV